MNNKEITIRSSAAEYLIFVAATGENPSRVELRYEDENIWLTQRMMAELYGVDVRTINEHIRKIYADNELSEAATVRNFRIVQTEGSREVSREVKHYSLQMIISIGFKVNNERAVQFRKWANAVVKDYTIQGWVMDDERLKRGGTVLTKDYFEKQLERIREIRLSERRFYQKITDIYATAIDYDPTAKATQRFFAAVQNKIHYSVHGHTAAELIYQRADADKEHMGLTTWEGAPTGKIHKYDVKVAKNYLTEEYNLAAILHPTEISPELRIATRLADGIEVIKLFPGLGENILRAMLSAPGLRAVVLETFGAGNAPTNEWFIRVLKEAIDRGVIILNLTQCGGGKVSMELYETGLRLQKIGVLCGHDMTTEAAVTKLMYVLGLGLSDEQTRALLRRPLRGEFTA